MLDEAGLEQTMDWYLPVVERQTGIDITYQKSGMPFPVNGTAAVHVYRVLQEALNNVARHSGAKQAWVHLRFAPESLELEVEDHGSGFLAGRPRQGIGLVAMRERAELLDGRITFERPDGGGTRVRLSIPKQTPESHA
jgi:signal transduction histidine kinase